MRHLVGKKGQVIFKTWIQKEVISISLHALSRFHQLPAHFKEDILASARVLMFCTSKFDYAEVLIGV